MSRKNLDSLASQNNLNLLLVDTNLSFVVRVYIDQGNRDARNL